MRSTMKLFLRRITGSSKPSENSCDLLSLPLMSRNAGSDENGDSGEISSVDLTIFMEITSTKMDLTCWRI